jgi:hypothetical protein
MRPFNDRLEILVTLVWMAACAVVAMQFASVPAAVAAGTGAFLGCVAARWAARRGAHLEAAITLCPFMCALLLLACDGMHRAQFAGTMVGPMPAHELAEILVWGGATFCISLALDLFRAELPQAAGIRVILIVAGFAASLAAHCGARSFSVIDFVLQAEKDPVHFFLLTGIVIAIGAVGRGLANPDVTIRGTKYPLRLNGLLALLPQGRFNPPANPNHSTGL